MKGKITLLITSMLLGAQAYAGSWVGIGDQKIINEDTKIAEIFSSPNDRADATGSIGFAFSDTLANNCGGAVWASIDPDTTDGASKATLSLALTAYALQRSVSATVEQVGGSGTTCYIRSLQIK
jgi:hypothetical protein